MDMLVLREWLLIKDKIIKINTKQIKISIGYAICNSNIRRKGEYIFID